MALRRQQISYDDWVHKPFYHQTTPRKWRSRSRALNIAANVGSTSYAPTIMYQKSKGFYIPGPGSEEYSWIGKRILYWTGDSIPSYVKRNRMLHYGKHQIGEYEIALFARAGTYRILFVDNHGRLKSKPEVSYQSARMNIFVDSNDIIRAVAYF
jgi:hypothetical protein